jgi:hypothetical protein
MSLSHRGSRSIGAPEADLGPNGGPLRLLRFPKRVDEGPGRRLG